jgi:hypothetical protein
LFYLSDSISDFCKIASIFCCHFLDIPNTAHNQYPNLKPNSFKRPFAERNALPAVAGAAGEQATATDHDGGKSGEAAPHCGPTSEKILNPQASQRLRPVMHWQARVLTSSLSSS